ncbi:MAG TPA: molybdopterin cofactor-binding domain-containing protein, partial [Candidatus Eisenbacteria bacterium]|nr:molybdopterin cofactor-binding domain-containing protein [Candidatus Eisenbacteria bacterium]
MKEHLPASVPGEIDYNELLEPVGYDFGLRRRSFVQILSAGILIATAASPAFAQNRGRRGGFGGGGPKNLGARIHLGKDGSLTVLTGKVEGGQGARAELTQAAAEELRVSPERVQLIMSDTAECPDDGITAGSGSTPRTVPAIRQAAASARELLVEFASKQWSVDAASCKVENGFVRNSSNETRLTYAD